MVRIMSNALATESVPPAVATSRNGARPLDPELRGRVERLSAKAGPALAAERLGISPGALSRCLAGWPVARGTVASITLALQGQP